MSRRIHTLLAFLLLLVLSGCSGEPATPEAAAASARAFLSARAAGDSGAVYAALEERAQSAMTRSLVAEYMDDVTATFGDIGTPVEVEPSLVRIPIKDLILTDEGRSIRWPEVWLTMAYEGKWRVAWAEPLFRDAAQAYQNDLVVEQLSLARKSISIDPYHYRGYLELHFAYRDLKRYREAEVALADALDRATPAELPVVHDTFARFKLLLNQPADGLAHARQALSLAATFSPETYPSEWTADTLVVAGRAALALNDQATAGEYAAQAATLDPENASLAVFQYQMASTGPSPVGP